MFLALVALLIASGSGKALDFVSELLRTFSSGAKSVYLGDQISLLSFQWLSFLFGFISQQLLEPYATPARWGLWVIAVGIASGIGCALLGLLVVLKAQVSRGRSEGIARQRAISLFMAFSF